MTMNERLRALLDECGVEWEAFDDFEQTTQWSTHNGAFVYWSRERDGKLLVETTAPTKCSASCTPEQAIAITLGREPDDAAMVKLHDRMNAAMLKYEMAQGIEKRDGDGAIVVPWVLKMHALLEEAATLGSCNCSNDCTNSERTRACLPHFWTHDVVLHVELPKLPESISVRLSDVRDREVGSARVWQYTRDSGTCKIHDCEGSFSAVNRPVWRCDCGAFMTQYTDATTYHKPRFCPNCGRKVVDE